ncbi:sensor histidine kinase KdpD [Microbacterium sp. cf332]|uniref:sensor histidine kinase n=1 Tax=Microbacterium sp. cf332 TaxID=1761804 RepID=UPI0008846B81|nr:HAMP domain-containing sensor histidine kinase [Microbacterium sp. cf332]SDQ23620.1 His Kinase A (phospho-acceptor) domain-containing protein [Microbacterium sp. cf332]
MNATLIVGAVIMGVALVGAGVAIAVLARTNVTRGRRIRELDELALRRADQVSALSHEIRTPLAIIRGSAELLADESAGELTEHQSRFVRKIIDNAHWTSSLAEQLLVRARIEAGLFSISRLPVDLRRLLRDIVEDVTPLTRRDIVLDSSGAPALIDVDPETIRQVVVNLISNAARSDIEGGRVEVRLWWIDDGAVIAVSDGGAGMSPEQRDRLFTRFASGQPLGNGTGIGLFISQQLVELHGGRLFVDTLSGRGTTVMFTLPYGGRHGG